MTPLEVRIKLKAAGYSPVACRGKRPLLGEWQRKINASIEEMRRWGGTETGAHTRKMPGFDIDVTHAEAAAAVEDMVRHRLDGRGIIPTRFGRRPKRALIFRTERPFAKLQANFVDANGNHHKLEFLADGQQLIVDGLHPDTKQEYSWFGAPLWDIDRNRLVEIDEVEARELLEAAAVLLEQQFGFKRVETNGQTFGAGAGWQDILKCGADDGNRNESLTRIAGHFLHDGMHPAYVRDFALWWNQTRCRPPDRSGRVIATIASIARKEVARRRNAKCELRDAELFALTSEAWEKLIGDAAERPAETDPGAPPPPVSLADWLKRDLPELDCLLGDLFTTTSRAMIIGPTGLGKTMYSLAVAMAMIKGAGFLHWSAGRKCRVLYIDGEMSRTLLKRRLLDAVRHAGGEVADGLSIRSKEDYPDMPPLNAPNGAGREWLDAWIEKHGPFDLIIFDNLQALLVGSMKEEEQWEEMLPWVRSLTKQAIGQIWLHHTGHDESKGYGSKAREWQMDTVVLMKRVKAPDTDLAFTLEFTKARERTPENRADFESMTLKLVDDEWVSLLGDTPAPKRTPTGNTRIALNALIKALNKDGRIPPTCNDIPDDTQCVGEELWRACAFKMGLASDADGPKVKNQAFKRAREALQARNMVGLWNGLAWLIGKEAQA
jgi:hypothetical protein